MRYFKSILWIYPFLLSGNSQSPENRQPTSFVAKNPPNKLLHLPNFPHKCTTWISTLKVSNASSNIPHHPTSSSALPGAKKAVGDAFAVYLPTLKIWHRAPSWLNSVQGHTHSFGKEAFMTFAAISPSFVLTLPRINWRKRNRLGSSSFYRWSKYMLCRLPLSALKWNTLQILKMTTSWKVLCFTILHFSSETYALFDYYFEAFWFLIRAQMKDLFENLIARSVYEPSNCILTTYDFLIQCLKVI